MSYAERTVPITVTAAAPAWFANTTSLTWTKVADGSGSGTSGGATPAQVAPSPMPSGTSPAPNLYAYSGAAVDQERGELLLHGGGHSAYAGNEVYALNLRTATPAWARLNNPSPGSFTGGGGTKNGPGQYTDDIGRNGAPIQGHTWNGLVFAQNRLYKPKIGGFSLASGNTLSGTPRVFWFDRSALKWTAGAMWMTELESTSYNVGYMQDAPAFYVPVDDAIYTGPSQYGAWHGFLTPAVVKINATTGAVVERYMTIDAWNLQEFAATTLGPTSRLVALRTKNSYRGSGLWVLDTTSLSNSSISHPSVTDSTGGLEWQDWYANGVYHAASNAILIGYMASESFVKLAIPANPKTDTWTATKIDPANIGSPSRVVPPSDPGPLGRFNMIENMGDGRSALVFQPGSPISPCYVMPLPTAGV